MSLGNLFVKQLMQTKAKVPEQHPSLNLSRRMNVCAVPLHRLTRCFFFKLSWNRSPLQAINTVTFGFIVGKTLQGTS